MDNQRHVLWNAFYYQRNNALLELGIFVIPDRLQTFGARFFSTAITTAMDRDLN
jgi:hypothetical protein